MGSVARWHKLFAGFRNDVAREYDERGADGVHGTGDGAG